MKIAIDARVLNKGITGTGRYLMNILEGLKTISSNHDYYLLTSNTQLFRNTIFRTIPIKKHKYFDKIYSPFWLNVILPRLLKELNIDVYFTTNILVPIVKLSGIKKFSVVHDVIHKVHKEYYPLSYRAYLNLFLPISLRKSDRIITVSEYSKSDIIRYYNISQERISVVPANAATNLKPLTEKNIISKNKILEKYGLTEKFILFVGNIERRKNITALIKIVEQLNKKGVNIPLVLAGRPGFGFNDYKRIIGESHSYVRYLAFVDDKDLAFLYNSAFVFVFPSFYEGFGIPPLEAMQCGVPVLASNTSSLPEVLGDGAVLIAPNDIDGFVNEIVKLNSDSNYYNRLRKRGLERSKFFSIENSTKALIKIFDEM